MELKAYHHHDDDALGNAVVNAFYLGSRSPIRRNTIPIRQTMERVCDDDKIRAQRTVIVGHKLFSCFIVWERSEVTEATTDVFLSTT